MEWMKVIAQEAREQLEANWRENQPLKGTGREKDYQPFVKLFIPWASGTWLLTEKEPGASLAFGLCDLGMGCPELGYVCLEELYDVTGPGGLRVEQDIHFKPSMTLAGYAKQSMRDGYIPA